MKRTQIYLDESQDERLAKRARAAGRTKSDLIREALDAFLARPEDERARLEAFRTAVRASSGAARRLPRGRDFVEEIRRADADRAREIEDRRGA